MKRLIPVLALVIAVLASGCTSQDSGRGNDETRARVACELFCKLELQGGADLEDGPCLKDELIEDWVCDVAHSPRTAVDDLPENQCPAYGQTAAHFVEVNPDCEFIRAV